MSKPQATRNYQPLPFRHLDPKRFEDLVRQLAYDFREWKSIEGIGRTGTDLGMDVRAIELAPADDREEIDEDADEGGDPPRQERLWVIQCKREQTFGPKRVREAVSESLDRLEEPPYGFILATSADLSLAAREALREEMRARGVEEFYAWGAAEIEDRLYQPRFDSLLFAYFGISLQIKRRSMRTELRSRLTVKRQLIKAVGEVREDLFQPVLLRDASEDRYPYPQGIADFEEAPPWKYYKCVGHFPPDHLAFETHLFFAYVNPETQEWDAIFAYNSGRVRHPEIAFRQRDEQEDQLHRRYWPLWNDLPDENRAWFKVTRFVPYERILAVDAPGDRYHEGPHLLVEYQGKDGPFISGVRESIVRPERRYAKPIEPVREKRIAFFPAVPPDEPQDEAPPTLDRNHILSADDDDNG